MRISLNFIELIAKLTSIIEKVFEQRLIMQFNLFAKLDLYIKSNHILVAENRLRKQLQSMLSAVYLINFEIRLAKN